MNGQIGNYECMFNVSPHRYLFFLIVKMTFNYSRHCFPHRPLASQGNAFQTNFLLFSIFVWKQDPEGLLQRTSPWSSLPSLSLTFPSLYWSVSHPADEGRWSRWSPVLRRIHEVIGCGAMTLFGPCRWLSFARCNLLSPLTLQIITASLKPLEPGSGLGYGPGGRGIWS